MEAEMNNEELKELCLSLLQADTEAEVIQILQSTGLWGDPTLWRYYGDREDNFSVIGNQQSRPEAALVEKVVNAVDAVLMNECWLTGISPENPGAPRSMHEAVALYFAGDVSRSETLGHIENWGDTKRTEVSRLITLAASGARAASDGVTNPCFTISDAGEGQTPRSMPVTLLSLDKKNKLRIQFVQGKFHMGGTGTFRFCGQQSGRNNLQLIVSKRNPIIAQQEGGNASKDLWGFTIVRREDPGDGKRSSVYKYLAPGGNILSFEAEPLPLLPSEYPKQFGKDLSWGMYIKLYEYNMQGLKTNIVFDLYNALSLLLPNIALPVRFYERRKGYAGHSFETTLSGLSVRLDEDKYKNLESGFPSSSSFVCLGQQMTALLFVFKKGQAGNYRRNEGVILTVNGQTHGYIPASFFEKDTIGMGYLQDSILVIVDCSNIHDRYKEQLFMNSRDRLCTCPLRTEIEASIAKLVREHPGLRKLKEQRRKEEIEGKLHDSKPLVDIVSKILKNSPALSKLFSTGSQIPNPFSLEETFVGTVYEGKRYPTYFKLKHAKDTTFVKHCPVNWRFRVQFETDAVNNYFDRDIDRGEFTLMVNGKIINDFVLNLWEGIASVTVTLPSHAKPGDQIKYEALVKDETRWEPFKNLFEVLVTAEEEHGKGTGKPKDHIGDDEGEIIKTKPSALALPEVIEVSKDEWENHNFDKFSALKVISVGERCYDFYINVDNIYLQTELKLTKIEPELLNARFKYGMVLIGMALLKEKDNITKKDDDPETATSIYEQIELFTKALSPILLPMISSLSMLGVDDIKPVTETLVEAV